ncbi:alpha/beta fold hydrolase [Tabrizicola sp.]|uniref:alpha/beta fold hydrolase n=1 Tax=Tabrizicola sp. TaxID=2005166 RepID=UPI003F2BB4FA
MSRSTMTTSRDGTPIAFERTGSGPALILIEPAGHYRGLSAFDDLVPLLTSDFTVCRYDRRGRGESGDTLPYAPDREVEDLAALVDAIGGRAFAYGYSSGALLALHAAARGVPLGGLILMEPPLQDGAQEGPDPLTKELADLVRAGRNGDAVAHFHASIGVPEEMVTGMRGTDRWTRMVGIAPTLVYDCRLSDAMRPGVLAAASVPTLVLDSEGSSDDLTGSAATAARLIPGARHKSLPGEWHVVAPDLIAREIKAHLGPLATTSS